MSRSSGLSFCNEAQVYPPESKIAREDGGVQQESPFPGVHFHALC